MKIEFVEIQNFRKLKACRIELDEKTTLFVGANNSGKTSAMDALIQFLGGDRKITTTDFTLSNWIKINEIGHNWESEDTSQIKERSIGEWQNLLPAVDIWISCKDNEIHYVSHLIPTLDWTGGMLGVRFRLEAKELEHLFRDYREAIRSAREITNKAESKLTLWPKNLREFLDKEINSYFKVKSYVLDPKKLDTPVNGIAKPQEISALNPSLEGEPLKGLIKINIINAQRGFSDPSSEANSSTLVSQLKEYYTKHINPSLRPNEKDIGALKAIEDAQSVFDSKLKEGFLSALGELEGLGYPGFSDPKISVACKIEPVSGLDHESSIQFDIIKGKESSDLSLSLPERYNGLGYQNLVSMVFKLLRYRDDWMCVGKVGNKLSSDDDFFIEPLHLVLIEEPEAHLHAQVQQVFIRKAYDVLRNHSSLKDNPTFTTQLVVSTHSSNIAHEVEFSSLRYFQKKPATEKGNVPQASVVNLSKVFGEKGNETNKFATRYLQTTHCDLFFADATVLIEGPAERMLIPHFIRMKYPKLNESFITLLEIRGSHAHRLRSLIENLGLITLVVTDLDSIDPSTSGSSKRPKEKTGQKSGNDTIKTWVPAKDDIDTLMSIPSEEMTHNEYPVRVAYQKKVTVSYKGKDEVVIPYTFEDALVFENMNFFKDLKGNGLIKKIRESISTKNNISEIADTMFHELKTAKKAEFALEMLYHEDPTALKVPGYIDEGLIWLEQKLERGKKDFALTEVAKAVSEKKIEKVKQVKKREIKK